MSDEPRPGRAVPRPSPKAVTVRDSLPPGAEVRLSDGAIKALVRLFGEEALRRAGWVGKRDVDEG